MPEPQSAWDCPICLRRVPAKVAECYCGYRRSEPAAPRAASTASRPLAMAAAVLCVLGGAAAYVLQAPPPPDSTPSTTLARAATPIPPPAGPAGAVPSTMSEAWKALKIETTPTPVVVEASATPTPAAAPTPDESVEAQRQQGVAAFEAALASLAARVADFREKLRRYDAQCEATNTVITGCDNARAELQSVARDIANDVEAADDQARRSWVDPGQRRALRERGGLDESVVRDVLKAAADASRR